MKRAALLAAILVAEPTCAKHPALTAGIAGGAVALVSCEIQSGEQSTCGIVTGIVALALGGLAWGITSFTDTNAHQLPSDDEELGSDGAVRVHTHTDLPPGALVDGGVVDAPAVTSPVPLPASDAGIAPAD